VSGQAPEWRLEGALDLASIPGLWTEMARRIRSSPELNISLKDVQRTSSAALALLLQGREEARKAGTVLRYTHIPDDLLALARVSNVEKLLLA
jgi:phospholipid transport system transporter-binding protein